MDSSGVLMGELFVGRAHDLAMVRRAVTDAFRAREAGLVLIEGEAGVGKTRLLDELAATSSAQGHVVVRGRCSADDAAPELWPLLQVMQALGSPGVAEPGGAAAPTRFAVAEAVAAAVRTAADEAGLVVLLDDLQWADPTTLSVLDFVVRAAHDRPVAFVAAQREHDAIDGEARDAIARLQEKALRLHLNGLDEEGVAELVGLHTGGRAVTSRARRLHQLTGGNPFFIEQYLRLMASGEDPTVGGHVPPTVLDAVRRRFIALDPRALTLLEVGALVGTELQISLLTSALEMPDVEGQRIVDDLVRRRLLDRDGPDQASFPHELLRDAVQAGIDDGRRVSLHLRIADELAQRGAPAAEQAAHVFAALPAGSVADAIELSRRAGHDAVARLAHVEAAGWFDRCLGLLYRDPGATEIVRLTTMLSLAEARMRGGLAGAADTYERARKLAQVSGHPVELARAAVGLAATRYRGPGWETQLVLDRPMLEEALAALEHVGPEPALTAQLYGHLAAGHALNGERREAQGCAERAAQAAAGTDDIGARHAALVGRRWALLGPGPRSGSPELTEQLRLLAVQTGDLEGEWGAARWAFHEALEAGDAAGIDRALRTTTDLASSLAEPALQADTLVQQGTVALLEGRWDDLGSLHEQVFAIAAAADVGTEAVLGQQLFLSRERGELEVEILRLILEANAQPLYHALVCWGTASAGPREALAGDVERFFGSVDVGALDDGVHLLPVLAMMSEAVVALGHRDHARSLLARLHGYEGQCVVAGVGPYVWTGTTDHYLGMLETVLGEHGDAERHLLRAIEVHRRMGARPWIVRSRLALLVLEQARDPGSRHLASSASDIVAAAESLGMVVVAAAAKELVAEAGLSPARDRSDRPSQWTLGREGSTWTVSDGSGTHRLADRKGLRALWVLMEHPGREVHVLELTAAVDGSAAAHASDLGPVLDDRAKVQLRERMRDLQQEVDEAEAFGDDERSARARAELDALVDAVASSLGLGGRDRVVGSAAERARVNLTRSIRTAVSAIAAIDDRAARHLEAGLRTGTYCSFAPDPHGDVVWAAGDRR